MFGVIFLLLFPLLSQGNVTPFTNCNQFFMARTPPTILRDNNRPTRYQQICQCLLNNNNVPVYYYATLYDTFYKIPVYSAYELQHATVGRQNNWYIEPQLDGGTSQCMGGLNLVPINNRGARQATNADYDKCGYDRGHVYPVSHTGTQDAMKATFTLTNAAPQLKSSNRGTWRIHEQDMVNQLPALCSNSQVFIVTGVIAGNKLCKTSNLRVAETYWSAYCCGTAPSQNSAAFIEIVNQSGVVVVHKLSVSTLEITLRAYNYYGQQFSVFGGNC